jgi:hypothetical protein
MSKYLLTVYQPTGGVLSDAELEPIVRDVEEVKQAMQDAGAWVFAGGLHPPSTATVLRPGDGDVLMTDGPFTEAKEHVGGLTIIEVADLDEALDWGRRLAEATTLPIEVRPFQH